MVLDEIVQCLERLVFAELGVDGLESGVVVGEFADVSRTAQCSLEGSGQVRNNELERCCHRLVAGLGMFLLYALAYGTCSTGVKGP